MKRRSWKVWVAGIALVQALVILFDEAVLWPMPSEAEQQVASVAVGMSQWEVLVMFLSPGDHTPRHGRSGEPLPRTTIIADNYSCLLEFQDGSQLHVTFGRRRGFDQHVTSISTTPAAPVHPLTRLRRTLARVFPFLAE
jgi:hypothetical protein